MEIHDIREFLKYFAKVHQRTMNVVRAIPPEKVDWTFRPGRFTAGDLARHIPVTNRMVFLDVAQGQPPSYSGCGRNFAATYEEILIFSERMYLEAVEILAGFSPARLRERCTTPDGASIPVWKWLRAMVEHEIHHRGQIYIYLSLLDVAAPPLYGLTAEQVLERSVPAGCDKPG